MRGKNLYEKSNLKANKKINPKLTNILTMWDVLMVHNIVKSCVLFSFLLLDRTSTLYNV